VIAEKSGLGRTMTDWEVIANVPLDEALNDPRQNV
jgi:hypothetical protein